MTVRTCLLISDDPDDHVEFSEALYEISDDTVLMTVADLRKAVDLLALKKCVPEYIFLNAGISALDAQTFLGTLQDPSLEHVQVIAWGDSSDFENLRHPRVSQFIDSDVSYSELKASLAKIVNGK